MKKIKIVKFLCIILFLNSPAFAEEKVYRHSEEGAADP